MLADHDGAVDSYGVELARRVHLTVSPTDATATVTAADRHDDDAHPARVDDPCRDGLVTFRAPPVPDAARLGPLPFTYGVTLLLDGVRHTARSVSPRDEDPESAPCVPLTFSPPLPRLRLR